MLALVVLAAGSSSRMKKNKLALAWQKGTVLETVLFKLDKLPAAKKVLVLGHEAEFWQDRLVLPGWQIVLNPIYEQGQSTSLVAGLKSLAEDVEAVMFCLADQPLVKFESYALLVDTWQKTKASLIVPEFLGCQGNPVIVGKKFFPELLKLTGDVGARNILRAHQTEILAVQLDDVGICADVDTQDSYEKWRKNTEIL